MKKQGRRIYAALLCSSMVLSLVSMPVSAAETGQLTNPPTSTEELHSPESASGNEAAAVLNGLYAALPVANGVKEVEQFFHIENLSDPENIEIQHNIILALRAHNLMFRDRDYVVKDDEVLIVDEFIGRSMQGRRFSDGL